MPGRYHVVDSRGHLQIFDGPLELWQRVAAEQPELLTLLGPQGFFTPGMWLGMTLALSFGVIF